ncbi:MAG: OsmC family protein, partial [Fimbriimonadales bacterium]
YRVEVEGERGPEGEYPRPYLSLRVRHIVKGENLDPAAVARAVELSDTKYCTVISTLRAAPKVESVWEIES